jgi:ribonuclease HII
MQWPDDVVERELVGEGLLVAGIDEVGRGAWAGPASVGVAVFRHDEPPPEGICDSKALAEDEREEIFPRVAAWCREWSVGHADSAECDRLGMTAALRLAAQRALGGLSTSPDALLLDGNFDYVTEPDENGDRPLRTGAPAVRTIVRGDAACVSIAAASIVAKVTRDRMMRELAPSFPAFDFDRNKGYPTRVHKLALAGFGLTSIHRRSWAFVDGTAWRFAERPQAAAAGAGA